MNIKQYQKIKLINSFGLDDDLTKRLKVIAELSGKSFEELESLPLSELTKVSKKYKLDYNYNNNNKLKKVYKIGNVKYKFKWKLSELSASQFISINYIISKAKDKDIEYVLHNILACLAYPVDFWGRTKPYNNKLHNEISENLLNNMDIQDAFSILSFFFIVYDGIRKSYLKLLTGKDKRDRESIEDEDEEVEDEYSQDEYSQDDMQAYREVQDEIDISPENLYKEKWGWIIIINDLSNDKRWKWDYFFNMDLVEFLNTVSFFKDKNDYEYELQKRANRKNNNI